MSDLTKVADKIRKLLNLAQGGATEGEAALAMEKVQELLAQYNLSMSDIKDSAEAQDQRGKDEVSWNAMYEYQRNLMGVIAECHYCIHWITKKPRANGKTSTPKAHHVLLGRKANVMATQILFEYLNTTINNLVKEVYTPPTHMGRSAMSWKEGCAARLAERLMERKAQADEAQRQRVDEEKRRATHPSYAGTKNALVLLTDVRQDELDANNDVRWGLPPGTTRQRRLEAQAQKQASVNRALELAASGEDKRVVAWMKMGYSEATARRWLVELIEAERKAAAMTPEQRAKLEAAEARKNARYWHQQSRKQSREESRRDRYAYDQGRTTANDIGLDKQLDDSKKTKLR